MSLVWELPALSHLMQVEPTSPLFHLHTSLQQVERQQRAPGSGAEQASMRMHMTLVIPAAMNNSVFELRASRVKSKS